MKNMTFRKSLTAAAVAASLGFPMAYAQDAEPQDQQGNEAEVQEELERIQVTGSRVKRVDLEPTQFVDFVDDSYLKDRGITNAITGVLDLPGVDAGTTPNIGGNTEASSQGLGQNTISLYGLGSQRTLTLINGGRFISSNSPVGGGSAPGSQVDVNNIPVSLIERIEVMKVGGAPVYGADAVAGVVNYILKKDYEGAEFSFDYGYADGINSDQSYRGLLGGNFDNDRGNLVVAVEYNETDNIPASRVPSLANDWSSFAPAPGQGVPGPDGEVPVNQVLLVPNPRAGILSNSGLITPGPFAATNVGQGAWGGDFIRFNPDGSGSVVPYDPGNPTGNTIWASGGDGLNLAEANTAREGFERYNITVLGNYEINDYVNLDLSIFANRSDAANQGYQAQQYSSGAFAPGMGASLQFDTDNPYLTNDARQTIEGLAGGPTSFYLQKAWLDLGQREIINESSVNSFNLTFNGSFDAMDRFFDWSVGYQKGISTVYSQDRALDDAKWLAAMDAGINPETGEIDCRYNYTDNYEGGFVPSGQGVTSTENVLGAKGSCSPLNPFGTISDEAKQYVLYNDQGQSRLEQSIFSAYIGGDLIDLPAGIVGFAAGYERRTENAEFRPDGSAELVGLSSSATEGGYTTEDMYVEFVVPIISREMDVPLLQGLTLDASYRNIDNESAGQDDVWAAGLNWRVYDDLMVRGNISETVRAPAVTELFLPVLEDTSFATDPCDARNLGNGPNPEVRQANCAADGLPTDFASEIQNASRRGFTGGNESLENEKAESTNVGIVYTPSWAEGFDISVDYIQIDIEDAIVNFSLTEILDACYDASDFPNKFCEQFNRLPSGQFPQVEAFQSGYVNAALRNFEGIEYTLNYRNDLKDYPIVGDFFSAESGSLTWKLKVFEQRKNETSNTGFDFTDDTGQFNEPDVIANLQVGYSVGDFYTFMDVNHTTRTKRDVEQTEPLQYIDQNGNPYTEIPSRTTFDLGATYQLAEGLSLRANVLNAFDWEPSPVETSIGRFTYGRTYNVGVTYQF
ncbi:TonB-dependent receptor domain-containing protein [Idiomarina loihiensis]|uniref:TonB-dependent receptor domain-containing protein n=1 Tax=Idiomarina loihiensis TaxID=135577 RepID=UPI00384ECBB1